MQGDLQGGSAERDKLGRYKPGYSSRRVKLERIAAKLNELVAEFFPNGADYSRVDASYSVNALAQAQLDPRLAGVVQAWRALPANIRHT